MITSSLVDSFLVKMLSLVLPFVLLLRYTLSPLFKLGASTRLLSKYFLACSRFHFISIDIRLCMLAGGFVDVMPKIRFYRVDSGVDSSYRTVIYITVRVMLKVD